MLKNSGDLCAAIVATGMAPAFSWWGCPRSTWLLPSRGGAIQEAQ